MLKRQHWLESILWEMHFTEMRYCNLMIVPLWNIVAQSNSIACATLLLRLSKEKANLEGTGASVLNGCISIALIFY